MQRAQGWPADFGPVQCHGPGGQTVLDQRSPRTVTGGGVYGLHLPGGYSCIYRYGNGQKALMRSQPPWLERHNVPRWARLEHPGQGVSPSREHWRAPEDARLRAVSAK
jgi:hypothetical protein